MIAEIINIGTELLLGDVVNTNAAYLGKVLHQFGIEVYHMSTLGDNHQRLLNQLQLSSKRSNLIILTGGLGPTLDDMTKEAVAQFINVKLELSSDAKAITDAYFKAKNIDISLLNQRQYLIPKGARVIPNPNGTACGLFIENNNHTFVLLPGPPNELIPMVDNYLKPYLKEHSNSRFQRIDYRLRGIGESKVAEILHDLIINQTNPSLATYASSHEVHLRLVVYGEDQKSIKQFIHYQEQIEKILSDYIFSKKNENILDILIDMIKSKGWTISFAESCTGGQLVSKWIEKPNVSSIIKESYITYSNEAKEKILGVSLQTLTSYGAVSHQTAYEMAIGLQDISQSDIAISITGIAGPTGDTPTKPKGLVYIGCAIKDTVITKELRLLGNRCKIQEDATQAALTILWQELKKIKSL